ncbi:MAG TPA: hypothetical protein VLF66_07655 [Thermoanaerobaculia bacterium]|nr:hypothetical protein [Thermoanaerobaculia bacterium]
MERPGRGLRITATYHRVQSRHLRDNPTSPAEFQDKWRPTGLEALIQRVGRDFAKFWREVRKYAPDQRTLPF